MQTKLRGLTSIFRNFSTKFLRVLIFLALIFLIALPGSKFFGYELSDKSNSSIFNQNFNLTDTQTIFSQATQLKQINDESCYAVDSDGNKLGLLIHNFPDAQTEIGFMGPIPILIGLNPDKTIKGLVIQQNNETPSYIGRITKNRLLEKFIGLHIENVASESIDAVSRATMSSNAIIKGVKARIQRLNGAIASSSQAKQPDAFALIVGWILLLIAIMAWYKPELFKKYRIYILLAFIAVYGFWQGWMISLLTIQSMFTLGIPLISRPLIATLVIISLILPLLSNKSFYCTWVCPYGACQELAGKLTHKKYNPTKGALSFLKHTRSILLLILVFLFILEYPLNLHRLEPFAAFMFASATKPLILLAIIFLLLSIFISRPWCRFFCPTGEFLEFFRFKNYSPSNQEKSIIKFEIIILLLILALIYKSPYYTALSKKHSPTQKIHKETNATSQPVNLKSPLGTKE